MAQQGWLLTSIRFVVYHFIKSVPAQYTYQLDYSAKNYSDYNENIAFYRELGWEHVTTQSGWHYYRAKASSIDNTPFFTDIAFYYQKYRPLIKLLIFITLLNLLIGLLFVSNHFLLRLINIFAALVCAYGVYKLQQKIINYAIELTNDMS